MLKGLDPLLSADLLQVLRVMGHGDEITLCDANFPADAVARRTTSGRLIRLDGVDLNAALRAVLSVLPLDTFVPCAAHRMEVVGDPAQVPPVMGKRRRRSTVPKVAPTPWVRWSALPSTSGRSGATPLSRRASAASTAM